MKYNSIDVGNRLRDIREEQRMSHATFAEKLGVSAEHIGRVERNAKQPSVKLLAEIAEQTGFSLGYIVFGVRNQTENRRAMRSIIEMLRELEEKNSNSTNWGL